MGIETIMIASAVVGAAGGVYSGIEANKAAKKQAGIYDEQANATILEGEFEVIQAARDFDTLLGQQKLDFAASGRELEGSPMLILDQTITDKETEINNIRRNAAREASQLRSAAKETKRAGRNAVISGVIGGASSGAKSYAAYKGASGPSSKSVLGAGSGTSGITPEG